MRTVQMTLEPELVARVDAAAKRLGTTRSGFTRQALAEALERLAERELERAHREGYERHPVHADEVEDWEAEQVWVD